MKMRSQQIRRRNTMMRELSEMLTAVLIKHGATEKIATDEAEELVFQIHRRWAGITLCIPKSDEVAHKRLNLHLIERYDGTNADVLVREYGVTESYIYKVVRAHHNSTNKNQLKFELDGPDL